MDRSVNSCASHSEAASTVSGRALHTSCPRWAGSGGIDHPATLEPKGCAVRSTTLGRASRSRLCRGSDLGADQIIRVHYERILAEPEATMKRISSFPGN